MVGCTNTKNTASTRAYHNLTSRYNVVFEARESYNRGLQAVDNGLKVDFTDLLPVYQIDCNDARQIASPYMDACTEECGKNILKHSITAKPRKGYSRAGMSESDQLFYNKPDFCKWIDDTYLLMGKANYAAGDLDRAESSIELCVTRFRHEPSKFEAQLWLAKTFWAQKKYMESQEILDKLKKDLRHPKKLNEDISKVYSQIAISNRDYDKAIEHLENALELARKKSDKAWITYLLGDLNRMAGHYPEARKCYERVVRMRPKYSMVFNAKINLAIVFTSGDNIDKIRAELNSLAADEKNAPYRDQIYYALAELEYRNGNINAALINYRRSAQYSSSNNIQKAKSYLAAADIYFSRNDYMNSGIFYDSTMAYMPATYSDYEALSAKARNLSELIRQIRAAEHQDSLQRVALLPESERRKLIQSIINDVINKEEEARLAASQPYHQGARDNSYGVEFVGQDGNPNFAGKWYLYNITSLNYGRSEFLKKWGNRTLEDNWRRKNKSSHEVHDTDSQDDEEKTDSTISNKSMEYYTRNLPLTDSAMQASIGREAEAWFAASNIYDEKINDIDKAIETLLHINQQHPDHYMMPQSLYQLVKLYQRKGEYQLSDYNKNLLVSKYPQSGYAKILTDPNYIKRLAARKQQSLDFYDRVINAFNSKQYLTSLELCKEGEQMFHDLDVAENFLFMKARSYGNLGHFSDMRKCLEDFVERFPNSKLIDSAKLKLAVLNSGDFDNID